MRGCFGNKMKWYGDVPGAQSTRDGDTGDTGIDEFCHDSSFEFEFIFLNFNQQICHVQKLNLPRQVKRLGSGKKHSVILISLKSSS